MFVERTTGDGIRGALLRFIGALSGLLAIAVGGPWALVVVARRSCGGWSPFHGLPTPADWSTEGVRTALTQRLTDSTVADVVVRTGLVVGWLAVVVIVWSVIAELVHLVRFDGIGVPDVRLLGPPQRLARIIASGLLVAVPVVGSGRTLAVGAVPLTPQPVSGASASWVGDDETTHRTVPRSRSDDQGASERSTGVPVHVVVAGDSVHSIAQRLAGPDQRSVTELADRILDLNLGRTMADGQVFVNAAFIDVGWTLELPVDPPVETRAGPVHTVDHGESLWSIADEHLGAGRRWSEIFDANDGRTFADGRRLDDPDLIMPGWQLELPMVPVEEVPLEVPIVPTSTAAPTLVDDGTGTSEPPPTIPDPTAEVTTGASAGSTTGAAPDTSQRNRWLDDEGQPAVELLTAGRAAMLSAGVLALVASRRRRRLRESGPDAVLLRPSSSSVRLERRLRSIELGDRTSRLDLAVRAAAPDLVAAGARVVALLVDADGAFELVASSPARPTRPWQPSVTPLQWRLDPSVATDELQGRARRVGAPCPTLVQIAVTEDGRDLYVDLEALGTLHVDAPVHIARSVLVAIAASIAASPAAETVTLVDIGVGDEAFLGHRHHRSAPDLSSALAALDAGVPAWSDVQHSTFELRSRSAGGEPWEPAVVFVGAGHDELVSVGRRAGVAVVSAAPCTDPGGRLIAAATGWRFEPLGVRCVPIGLSDDEAGTLADLVRCADLPFDDSTLPPVPEPGQLVARVAADPPSILVRLFGPVAVRSLDGRLAEFDRQKSKELVVWLATHRERSTRTSARTALWELDVRDATFSNVVSDARRTLGRLVPCPDGVEWIGRTLTEDLPLHPAVRTDADLVREALAALRSDAPGATMDVLREAVDLIVGMPFEGTDYLWTEAEGIASELVLLATSATTRLAEACLAIGDLDGVFEATARGLQVLPGHEAMVGLRMRAYGSVGDRAGIRREWAQYERVTHADPWSDGEPSPVLVGLRRELLEG